MQLNASLREYYIHIIVNLHTGTTRYTSEWFTCYKIILPRSMNTHQQSVLIASFRGAKRSTLFGWDTSLSHVNAQYPTGPIT